MLRKKISTRFTKTAFLRDQPKLSIEQAIRFSKTAVTVEKLANVMNTKNRAPQSSPSGICVKICGKVMKIRDGP